MTTSKRIVPVLLLACVFTGTAAFAADFGGWHPSVSEAAVLPRFCWKQFFGKKFSGPQFEIPRATCGVGTNHYCPALVVLNRANGTFGNPVLRRKYLLAARKKVQYTLRWTERFPACPIRGRAERMDQLIERELREIR